MNHTTALGGQSGPSSNRPNFDGSTSVGYQAGFDGAGAFSVALGGGSGFSPIDLLGSAAHARGDYSIAIGGGKDDFPGARANGLRSIAIGQKSVSGADFGIGVGFNTTTAFAGTAIGTDARATGDSSTAVGRLSSATGLSSVTFGASATASGQRSVAIGAFSGTTGSGSSNIALGYNAGGNVLGSGNIAIGLNAGRDVTASSSISIGWGSRATASSSVAIGLNSVASASNTVSVGRETSLRRIVNVATGVNPNDAVNVAQLQAALAAAAVPPPAPALVNTRDDTAVITMRRELDRLQSLVASLQQRLAALESKSALARAEAPP